MPLSCFRAFPVLDSVSVMPRQDDRGFGMTRYVPKAEAGAVVEADRMSSIEFRTLKESDFPEWVVFTDTAYGEGYVLTDKVFLEWYLKKHQEYETVIAVDGHEIVGAYCALQAPLSVNGTVYSFCWFVSGMVLPEHRNQGIGKTFVQILLDKFDACGVIGFNAGVRKNYMRFGFKQFDFKTLRRFALLLNSDAHSLIREDLREGMKKSLPVKNASIEADSSVRALNSFDESVCRCADEMQPRVKVSVKRTPEYLNWRYFENPRVRYECSALFEGGRCRAYVVSRHERFFPTELFATRIIDLVGSPEHASRLVQHEISKAARRNDAFLDFSFTGGFFEKVLTDLGFSELVGDQYGALPLVSSPLKYRDNDEFVCLGSKRFPGLFDNVEFGDIYFVRGDSDRDRYNPMVGS